MPPVVNSYQAVASGDKQCSRKDKRQKIRAEEEDDNNRNTKKEDRKALLKRTGRTGDIIDAKS